MPLASSWVAPTRVDSKNQGCFLKLEERGGGGRQANPIGSDTTHSNSHRRSCNGILHLSSHYSHRQTTGTCSECLPQLVSRRDGAGLQAQRALAVAFEAGDFFGCPQRDYPHVKKGKCYIAWGHSRVLKQRNLKA